MNTYNIEVRAPFEGPHFTPYTETVQAPTSNDAVQMVQRRNPGCSVISTGWVNDNNNTSSSVTSSSSGDLGSATFGLIGLGVVGTYQATKFTLTKVVVPTAKFTGKYTWKGMNYVATTVTPKVYSFTKNTVVPGVVKLTQDVIEFLTQLVNKVLGKTNTQYPQVQSQYRREVI